MRRPHDLVGYALVTLVLLACVPVTASANLVANGTFDTDFDSWIQDAGSDCHAISHSATVGNPVGSVLLNRCGSPFSDASVTQTVIGLAIGAEYLLSWENQLHVALGPNGTSFGVFIDGAVAKLSENLSFAFVADSLIFTATDTSHTFTFAAELDTRTPGVSVDSDVSYYLDNVSLTARSAVPEPGSLALLVSGVGMMGLAGWRCRRPPAPATRPER